ncbi:MAG: hypothetical protein K2V38_17490, partial [Gemmataceae bacterium]|nr:hypothetical protein [Gemmataceae bacterium]
MARSSFAVPLLVALAPLAAAQDKPAEGTTFRERLKKENAALKQENEALRARLTPFLQLPQETLDRLTTKEKIKALGKEAVEDLMKGRATRVYDGASCAFCAKKERKAFEEWARCEGAFLLLGEMGGKANRTD